MNIVSTTIKCCLWEEMSSYGSNPRRCDVATNTHLSTTVIAYLACSFWFILSLRSLESPDWGCSRKTKQGQHNRIVYQVYNWTHHMIFSKIMWDIHSQRFIRPKWISLQISVESRRCKELTGENRICMPNITATFNVEARREKKYHVILNVWTHQMKAINC